MRHKSMQGGKGRDYEVEETDCCTQGGNYRVDMDDEQRGKQHDAREKMDMDDMEMDDMPMHRGES